jgi:hypothetical protein
MLAHYPFRSEIKFSTALGGRSPGELSQLLMRRAVSACRARRNSNSWAGLPGARFLAASASLRASAASRSSNVVVCLIRNLFFMTRFSHFKPINNGICVGSAGVSGSRLANDQKSKAKPLKAAWGQIRPRPTEAA